MKRFAVLLLVMTALSGVARGDERGEIRGLFPKKDHINTLKTAESWGLVSVDYAGGHGAGMYLVHKMDGRWHIMAGGGGALGVSDAARIGLPSRYWDEFFHPGAGERQEAAHQGPGWPETSQRVLGTSDIEYRSAWELTLMRNEILARHGRQFKDAELRAYFLSKTWYRPDPNYSDKRLTGVERTNIQVINDYQRKHNKLD